MIYSYFHRSLNTITGVYYERRGCIMSISDICRTITSLQMKENPVMNFD